MVKRLTVKKRKKILSELTQEIPANGIITVGNDSSATIELQDEKIAPEQVVIVCEEGTMTLLCRVAGTAVNGEILPQGALHNLQFGDEIKIDGYTLIPESEEANRRSEVERNNIQPEANETGEQRDKSERSLSDVLETLQGEEKFYFLIGEGDDARRVYLESEEMWLGWTEAGECAISSDANEIELLRAQIRKDWSGVVLYPQKPGSVRLGDEILSEPRRLKNDDEIFLLSKEGAKFNLETTVKFHEPPALLILDSILPKELPPPVSLDEAANDASAREFDESVLIISSEFPPLTEKTPPKRNFFGYFTLTEIIIMAIGTLITAVVIYLILEFY
jgi:hypothetical protein